MNHVLDRLHDWFIGVDDDPAIEEHIKSCKVCQKGVEDYFLLIPEVPQPKSSETLLENATSYGRFASFTQEIARLADTTVDRAKEWLSRLDAPPTWRQSVLPTMQLFDIEGGPKVENAILGFIKLEADSGFPEHKHAGLEQMFVLQGTLIDEDGTIYGPGTIAKHERGTVHSFSAGPDVPLIYVTVNQVGVEIGGKLIGPYSDDL